MSITTYVLVLMWLLPNGRMQLSNIEYPAQWRCESALAKAREKAKKTPEGLEKLVYSQCLTVEKKADQ